MSGQVADLGFSINTADIEAAARKLDQLGVSADKVSAISKTLGKSLEAVVLAIANSDAPDKAVKRFENLAKATEVMNAGAGATGSAFGKMADGMKLATAVANDSAWGAAGRQLATLTAGVDTFVDSMGRMRAPVMAATDSMNLLAQAYRVSDDLQARSAAATEAFSRRVVRSIDAATTSQTSLLERSRQISAELLSRSSVSQGDASPWDGPSNLESAEAMLKRTGTALDDLTPCFSLTSAAASTFSDTLTGTGPAATTAATSIERAGAASEDASDRFDGLATAVEAVGLSRFADRAGIAGRALAALGPLGVAAAGGIGVLVAAETALSNHASEVDDQLEAINKGLSLTGREAAATGVNFQAMATRVAAATGAAASDIRSVTADLIKDGAIPVDQIEQAITLGAKLKDTLGGDFSGRVKDAAQALTAPAAAAGKLEGEFKGLIGAETDHIKTLDEQGHRLQASGVLIDTLTAKLGTGQADGMTGAVRNLTNAWDRLTTSLGKGVNDNNFFGKLGESAVNKATQALTYLNDNYFGDAEKLNHELKAQKSALSAYRDYASGLVSDLKSYQGEISAQIEKQQAELAKISKPHTIIGFWSNTTVPVDETAVNAAKASLDDLQHKYSDLSAYLAKITGEAPEAGEALRKSVSAFPEGKALVDQLDQIAQKIKEIKDNAGRMEYGPFLPDTTPGDAASRDRVSALTRSTASIGKGPADLITDEANARRAAADELKSYRRISDETYAAEISAIDKWKNTSLAAVNDNVKAINLQIAGANDLTAAISKGREAELLSKVATEAHAAAVAKATGNEDSYRLSLLNRAVAEGRSGMAGTLSTALGDRNIAAGLAEAERDGIASAQQYSRVLDGQRDTMGALTAARAALMDATSRGDTAATASAQNVIAGLEQQRNKLLQLRTERDQYARDSEVSRQVRSDQGELAIAQAELSVLGQTKVVREQALALAKLEAEARARGGTDAEVQAEIARRAGIVSTTAAIKEQIKEWDHAFTESQRMAAPAIDFDEEQCAELGALIGEML